MTVKATRITSGAVADGTNPLLAALSWGSGVTCSPASALRDPKLTLDVFLGEFMTISILTRTSYESLSLVPPCTAFTKTLLHVLEVRQFDELVVMDAPSNSSVVKEFDVFLSHSGKDKEWVRNLAERLEAEGISESVESRRIKVFLDEWDIDFAENIINRLNDGLQKSSFLAAILSPEFLDSGWANQEWTHWFMNDPRAPNLLPLLYRSVSLDGKRRIELPMPFKTAKHFDFRENNHFERIFVQLLRRVRGLKPQRGSTTAARYTGSADSRTTHSSEQGLGWEADRLEEMILGNLLEVKSYPERIWSGATNHERPEDVRAQITSADLFILRANRLWTFEDLNNESAILRPAVDSTTVSVTPTSNWMTDADKSRWLIALFNQVLKSRLGKMGIKKDNKGRFYFKANADGTPRKFTNKGDRERAVAAKKVSADGKSSFFVHFAAFMKFERIANKFFLIVEPGYVFTENGENPLTPKATGKLSIQWGGQQRNDTIFRNLLFWIKLVANSSKEFALLTGGVPIVLSGVPVSARMDRGLESDQVEIGALLNIGADDVEDDLEQAAENAEIVQEDEEANETEENL